MVVSIIISVILLAAAFIWNVCNKTTRAASAFVLMLMAAMLFRLIVSYKQQDYPSAKSVYEGKTTLQIIYEDGMPIDTVIVFKPEFRKK